MNAFDQQPPDCDDPDEEEDFVDRERINATPAARRRTSWYDKMELADPKEYADFVRITRDFFAGTFATHLTLAELARAVRLQIPEQFRPRDFQAVVAAMKKVRDSNGPQENQQPTGKRSSKKSAGNR